MKKFFTALLLIFTLASESYAESGDIYVRQDVFDAKMEALFSRLERKIDTAISDLRNEMNTAIGDLKNEVNTSIDSIKSEITSLKTENGEIRGEIKALSARIDGLDKRMDSTNTFLYYLLVLLAALIILPPVSRWFEAQKEAKNFTLDDVRKLIAEEISKNEKIYAPA